MNRQLPTPSPFRPFKSAFNKLEHHSECKKSCGSNGRPRKDLDVSRARNERIDDLSEPMDWEAGDAMEVDWEENADSGNEKVPQPEEFDKENLNVTAAPLSSRKFQVKPTMNASEVRPSEYTPSSSQVFNMAEKKYYEGLCFYEKSRFEASIHCYTGAVELIHEDESLKHSSKGSELLLKVYFSRAKAFEALDSSSSFTDYIAANAQLEIAAWAKPFEIQESRVSLTHCAAANAQLEIAARKQATHDYIAFSFANLLLKKDCVLQAMYIFTQLAHAMSTKTCVDCSAINIEEVNRKLAEANFLLLIMKKRAGDDLFNEGDYKKAAEKYMECEEKYCEIRNQLTNVASNLGYAESAELTELRHRINQCNERAQKIAENAQHYEVLGLEVTASESQIRQQWKKVTPN